MLKRSPVMLPIPGTSRLTHLEENVAGAAVALTDEEFAELDAASLPTTDIAPRLNEGRQLRELDSVARSEERRRVL